MVVAIATVAGLGYIWTEGSRKARTLWAFLGPVYRWVLELADAVIYLNGEERQTLCGPRTALIPCEGIDRTEFCPEAVSLERRVALRAELGLTEDTLVLRMGGGCSGIRELGNSWKQPSRYDGGSRGDLCSGRTDG